MYSVLNEIIDSRAILKHSGGSIIFEEPEETALLKKVSFNLTHFHRGNGGLIKNAIVLNSDNNQNNNLSRFCFYLDNDCPNISRQCDYIIFHCHNGKTNVILCELKSSDTSQDEAARIHNQFIFSQLFAEYLLSIAKERAKQKNAALINADTVVHKVALVHMPNVASPAPLGVPPMNTPNDIDVQESKGIKNIFLQTNSSGHTSLQWRKFMEAVV
ncbi:hypothetical protein Q6U60_003379 [Vibrio alginolyticus]|nr:hypothetical protein [Vibrio alginolyticus]